MEEETLSAYRKAGEIASEAREWSKKLIKEDALILEIAEKIEGRIKDNGAEIAFPVNICLNDVAAHYTPKHKDATRISEEDIVTIDLGAHVDGYIADTAYTIDLSGRYGPMLKANQEALEKAISMAKPGAKVKDIGREVHRIIADAGYKPIENLTGHQVERYDLHAGISIPNIEVKHDWELKEDMVVAIEPFATDGMGRVVESNQVEIFSQIDDKPTRMREARILMKEIEKREGLPFAERWLSKKISPLRLGLILRNLVGSGILHQHPILHEKGSGMVSQFEHTLIITADGCEVTTL